MKTEVFDTARQVFLDPNLADHRSSVIHLLGWLNAELISGTQQIDLQAVSPEKTEDFSQDLYNFLQTNKLLNWWAVNEINRMVWAELTTAYPKLNSAFEEN